MADQTELRMNLAAVKRTDPYAVEIVETSAHVAFYTFNYEDNEWEKTDVEGAFFVYRRTAEPFHSIFINNRLNTESLVEPITADLELQAQPPFLLYRNERSRIRGFWFYNKEELERVAALVNGLVKTAQKRTQNHQPPQPLTNLFANSANNKLNANGGQGAERTGGAGNIFSMLSKAQNDFDNSQNPGKLLQQPTQPPRPGDGGSMLAQLLPKMNMNGKGPAGKEAVTSQSVMNFFASAKPTIPTPPQPQAPVIVHHQQPVPIQVLHSNGNVPGGASPAPPILQRLISNPVTTVEQIEMQQRAVTPQQAPKEEPGRQQPVTKENGFNWKSKGGGSKANNKDGGEAEWPALGMNKVNKSASSSAVSGEEKAPVLNGRAGTGGKTPNHKESVVKPALMTPTMFKKTAESKGEPTNPSLVPTGARREATGVSGSSSSIKETTVVKGSSAAVDLAIKPEPLTQSQMLQALTYLMKTDADFMKKLHEAYVKSFAEMMAP